MAGEGLLSTGMPSLGLFAGWYCDITPSIIIKLIKADVHKEFFMSDARRERGYSREMAGAPVWGRGWTGCGGQDGD